ncbi:phosphoenolpyruvate carboxylase [Ferrimonas lipolytica]|uniref:Phosphoenolpyruvate carboxylase n=1 Tax=Ferrimonas lipolytica TaxID=2724191 RepID=A0A6H1UDG5_9GAMM|nr:phosphoenolpyruvate carboxylase [Ferrimonas lipolytica]QIZ76383.1 phosphoenolpyruvate carboxylase [Ferrimonas lipolytica]
MSENLKQVGKKFLALLNRNADLLLDTYLSGTVNDDADPKAVDKLVKQGVLRRPDAGESLRLAPSVRDMLGEALKDERNRQVDANVGSAISTMKTLAAHYKEALHHKRFSDADVYLGDLTEVVFSLKESLRQSTRSLWSRINNDFGYVGSIDAKIRENQLAQEQVSELLISLELFRFDELAELAGDARELRRLLVISLQHALVDCAQELGVVQNRLLALLGRFREIQGRTRLLKGFLLHVEQHPDYRVGEHADRVNVPPLFNQASACITPAAVNVNDSNEEHTLLQLVSQIRRSQNNDSHATTNQATAFELGQAEAFELPDEALKQAVDQFYIEAIDGSGVKMSALEYHQKAELTFAEETWLYQVICGFDSLPLEQRQFFELEYEQTPHPQFSGNLFIEDVRVWLQ